jgi:hypothetical protein
MKLLSASLAAVVVALGMASSARAGDDLGPYSVPSEYRQAQYGLNPCLKKLLHIRKPSPVPPHLLYPQGQGQGQGTLVFPNHPFARSPRDYFMVD